MRALARPALLTLAALIAAPFALYSLMFGLEGIGALAPRESYLIAAGAALTNGALGLHMIAGGLLTLGAPLQLIAARRWTALHRRLGPALVALALATAAGGLVFIPLRGTIGGAQMSVAFAAYGAALAICAIGTWRARGTPAHPHWGLRLFVLAMGSLIFRLHYGIWFALTGGLGSTPALDGPFDRVQVWAFWLPYLAAAEIWIGRSHARRRPQALR